MTEARSTRRRRRGTNDADSIPPAVAAWFAGQAFPVPWEALLRPDSESVPGWWREWAAAHPGATPPADVTWISWGTA